MPFDCLSPKRETLISVAVPGVRVDTISLLLLCQPRAPMAVINCADRSRTRCRGYRTALAPPRGLRNNQKTKSKIVRCKYRFRFRVTRIFRDFTTPPGVPTDIRPLSCLIFVRRRSPQYFSRRRPCAQTHMKKKKKNTFQ